jgi:hypothetical protein
MLDFIKKIFRKSKPELAVATRRTTAVCPNRGEKVHVRFNDQATKAWRGTIKSLKDDFFSVNINEALEETAFKFVPGINVLVTVFRGNRTARFTSKLINIDWPEMELEYPHQAKWEEEAQKQYVRIKTDVPAKVRQEGLEIGNWQMIRMTEFSLEGIRLTSPVPYKEGNRLRIDFMSFEFPVTPMSVVQKLIVTEETGGVKGSSDITVKFESLTELERQVLSNYAYKLQKMSPGGS